ncbi:MAG TPA: hypothetical protein PKX56_01300 [Marmoricola sp.]|nr:hypothetical protein [Marmoricola sp.]
MVSALREAPMMATLRAFRKAAIEADSNMCSRAIMTPMAVSVDLMSKWKLSAPSSQPLTTR